ncbi:putative Peptidase M1 membrane alanine aminopeptidase [Candidatus Promineifilum breve]|uniref:Peptidase M1 membrane alanine aminopeptidase n=1 Tax=Candidatus Promineifilum breve TaxID=1806508 RepID=A0A160T571_9CHLR|nr:M1 family metallopeptidase [Candidatus Promineifilum breve]CUS03830.2 putative Peptidase M1 membrane alanine aminopeptidase [Candidatus Promineifilum breve]
MNRSLVALLLMLALLTACRAAPAALPTAVPTAAAPGEVATEQGSANELPTATIPPIAPEATPPADPPPAATQPSAVEPSAVQPPDRAVFAAGLIDAERAVLDDFPAAPIYQMAIEIDESLAIVRGRQTVFYTNLEDTPLDALYFHLHAKTLGGLITVTDVTVDGTAVIADDTINHLLRVPLPAPLAPGAATAVAMNFTTIVPTEIGRNYGVLAYYEEVLALAHFYPMLAVYDATGWNTVEPDVQGDLTYSDAAFFLVEVTAPANVTLVGSGAIVAETTQGDTQTITYAVGPARDFYLAAGDFAVTSATVGETTINSYAPSDMSQGAALALEVAAAALTSLNERLGSYPYTELDIVTTPTSALGIEYPGLIVGTLRMYDTELTSQSGMSYADILESTTAHEVNHQWFYNLVGNDQLDEPWLDESLTSYSTYRYYADRYGQEAADNYFNMFEGRWAMVEGEEIPVGMPVAEYEEAEYSAIVYGRGAVFLRLLEKTIGRETFDAFLRDYIQQFRWRVAGTAAFRALAEEHCACDLGPLFAAWVYEE